MNRLFLMTACAFAVAAPALADDAKTNPGHSGAYEMPRPATMMPGAPSTAHPPGEHKMPGAMTTTGDIQSTYKDIQATMGSVPNFFKAMPESVLPGAWEVMKNVELSDNTAIPRKYKELIGLAVAGQIPCNYCSYFHQEAARANGATDQEIKEAVALSASARLWSTVFAGAQVTDDSFRAEVDKMAANMQKNVAKGPREMQRMQDTKITDSASAMRDIEQVFGFVPAFIKHVPQEALPGLWRQVKMLDLSQNTAIPAKYKDLLNIAVDANIGCKNCLVLDSAMAKVDNVSQREIDEAVLVAGIVRQWSTVLNGLQVDPAQFRRDVDKTMAWGRSKMVRPAGPGAEQVPKAMPKAKSKVKKDVDKAKETEKEVEKDKAPEADKPK